MGKITIIKLLALSKSVHLFISLPDPLQDIIRQINNIFYSFIWIDGPHKIKRITLAQKYKHGGQQMINLQIFIKALNISWFRRKLTSSGK